MSVFDNINYDNCITNLTSSIQKHFNLTPNYKTNEIIDSYLSKRIYKNVVLIIFDALGESIISKHKNDFLLSCHVGTMHSTFPPTTANCTIAYQSGLNPITTGWLGWSTYYKDLNIAVDNFTNADSISKNIIEGNNIADMKMPFPLLGNQIQQASNGQVNFYSVWPDFKENGCMNLKHFKQRIKKLCKQDDRKYIYAYWGEPDKTMHEIGTKSKQVQKIIDDIAKTLKYLKENTKDSIFIISADHSQVDVSPIALYTYYDVMECLKAPISCDSRCCFFFIKENMETRFTELFNKYFKDYYDLYSKEEVLERKLFGPGKVYDDLNNIIGDYIAIAKDKYYFMQTPDYSFFKGHHAGGIKEESIVPILIIEN